MLNIRKNAGIPEYCNLHIAKQREKMRIFARLPKKSRPDAEVTANILQYKHRKPYIYGNY